jgi:hypothetical protein
VHVLDLDDRLHFVELIFMDCVGKAVKEHHNFLGAMHRMSRHLGFPESEVLLIRSMQAKLVDSMRPGDWI